MLGVEKQVFLQRMIAKNYMALNDAINLLNKIVTEINKSSNDPPCDNIGPRELNQIIKEINSLIKLEELQLIISRCEATAQTHLTLLSIGNNYINALQLNQHPAENHYWEKLMKEIIVSNAKALNRLDCLNLVAKHDLKIKLQDAEAFLNTCIRKGYLTFHNGLYYLGGRTLAEFGKQFRQSYADYIQVCELCSELCCYGKTCTNCSKVMHCYCLEPALENSNECPLCHVQWGNFDFEKGAANAEDNMDQTASDQNESQQSMDTDDASQSSRSTRRSQRKKKRPL